MRLCAAVLAGLVRAMDDNTIRAAVDLWESDKAAAEAQYSAPAAPAVFRWLPCACACWIVCPCDDLTLTW